MMTTTTSSPHMRSVSLLNVFGAVFIIGGNIGFYFENQLEAQSIE
jgi:hypothetical protein